jgi:predicted HTH transcriptional regulator
VISTSFEQANKEILKGENIVQDFKQTITDTRKIACTLVAFANTIGGKLWIGVKDNGHIKGTKAQEELYMIEAAADIYSNPKIDFEYQFYELDNKKQLLEIYVPQSSTVHRAKNTENNLKAYARQNDNTVLVSNVVYKSWINKRAFGKKSEFSFSSNEELLLLYLRQNKSITLSRFVKITDLKRPKAENILAKLLSWKLIGWENNQGTFEYLLV